MSSDARPWTQAQMLPNRVRAQAVAMKWRRARWLRWNGFQARTINARPDRRGVTRITWSSESPSMAVKAVPISPATASAQSPSSCRWLGLRSARVPTTQGGLAQSTPRT